MSSSNRPTDTQSILAPSKSNFTKKGPDLSVIKPSIQTTLTGMRQAVRSLETGTPEVKKVLFDEVNVIYECKVCMNMFRSIANLIAHKRTFCKEVSAKVRHKYEEDENKENFTTVEVTPEEVDSVDVSTWNMQNYSPSMDLIRTTGILNDMLAGSPVVNKLRPAKTISSVTSKLLSAVNSDSDLSDGKAKQDELSDRLIIEPIFNTSNALFQTWKVSPDQHTIGTLQNDLNIQRVIDNHVIVQRPIKKVDALTDKSAVKSKKKDTEGLILRLPCCFCKAHFSKFQFLRRHMKRQHDKDSTYSNAQRKSIMKKAFQGSPGKWNETPEHAEYVKQSAKTNIHTVSSTIAPVKKCRVTLQNIKIGDDLIQKLSKNGAAEKPSPVDHEEDRIPADVESKLKMHINRRNLQCKLCYRRFSRTQLALQHVASTHLHLKRFQCNVCDFGAWNRNHVLRHVEKTHRSRNIADCVDENEREVYFSKFINLPEEEAKEKAVQPPGLLLNHNLKDFDCAQIAVCPKECEESRLGYNGKNSVQQADNDMVPVSFISGIKSQIRTSVEEMDSDTKATFNRASLKRKGSSSSPTKDRKLSKVGQASELLSLPELMNSLPSIWVSNQEPTVSDMSTESILQNYQKTSVPGVPPPTSPTKERRSRPGSGRRSAHHI